MPEKTLHDGLVNRRSVRSFSDRDVPESVLRDIVEDARWAPSWANGQPWKLYVATGKAARDIRGQHQSGTLRSGQEVPAFRGERWGARERQNMGRWGRQIQGYLGSDRYQFSEGQQNLFNAPAIAVITISKDAPLWELIDAGAFEQSLLLSAYDHGVDSIVAVAFVMHPDYLHEKLGIPDDETIVMGVGLGYRTDDRINSFKSDRVPLDDMLVIKNR